MRGGYDRSDLRPLDPETGHIILDQEDEFEGQFDDVLGNHTGAYAANNVYNPLPNCRYYLADGTRLGRAHTRALIQQGAEVVTEDDQEKLGDMSDLVMDGTRLDSSQGHSELVLLRFPIHKYNQFKQARLEYKTRQFESQVNGEQFLQRDEFTGTRYALNKDVYSKATDHGMTWSERVED